MATTLGNWHQGAVLSNDGKYRYHLWRRWSPNMGTVCWIMLNPSTANHEQDDATIRRCVNFSRRWGYGAMEVVNLFALRATDPTELLRVFRPIGEENDEWVRKIVESATMTMAAWGVHGAYFGRSISMRGLLSHNHVLCLGKCSNGEPKHPVRLSYQTRLEPFIGKAECLAALNAKLAPSRVTPYTHQNSC